MTITALLPVQKEYHRFYAPDRNFLPFAGKPMYQFMIDKLLSIPLIGHIVINTDAEEVKQHCRNHPRITVIDRPEILVGEDIDSDLITAYTLDQVEGEHFVEIQSFNPLLTRFSITSIIRQYFDHINIPDNFYDSIFSSNRCELRHYDLDQRALNDEYPFVIFENRILHTFSRTNFRKNGNRKIGKMAMLFETREIENTLVDSETNYALARLVYENMNKFPSVFHSGE